MTERNFTNIHLSRLITCHASSVLSLCHKHVNQSKHELSSLLPIEFCHGGWRMEDRGWASYFEVNVSLEPKR